jgi:crotonobetainyl-CoA:carnitine CoA-transferase CaiB-like acyl-CoA transferase
MTVSAGLSPLEGIVVADFSRVLAGPLATMTLADLGARVIKVERPGSGDDTRSWGPPFSATGSTYFESVNRNKESVCWDLTDPGDLALARSLAAKADVIVENFKPGAMRALGLDYDSVRADNASVVYVSITGFGERDGAQLPGYDFAVQALGGLMSITGEAGGEPMKVGVALVDVLTAKDVAIGVLAALRARERSGAGCRLELNLLSSLQGALANQAQAFLGAGVVPGRLGNVHPSIAPYQTFRCGDGELAIACGNDLQFARLAAVLGIEEVAQDERFVTNPQRVQNRRELESILEERLATASAPEWEERLMRAGVPAGHVATIDEGIRLAERLGLAPTIDVVDAAGETVSRQIRHPISWTPALAGRRSAPPALGEHTDRVRAWIEEDA